MDIQSNLKEVRAQLPPQVSLVAVSKFHPNEAILAAYETGQRIFGESKEQELSQYFPRSKVPDIKTTCFDHNSELVKEIVLQDNNKYLTGWFILIAVSALLLEQLVWRKKLN